MHKFVWIAALALAGTMTGCRMVRLTVPPRTPRDLSATSANAHAIKRIIIVPPAFDKRALQIAAVRDLTPALPPVMRSTVLTVATQMYGNASYSVPLDARIEKELIHRGIQVVSSGVTGRVVYEWKQDGQSRYEAAAGLSVLERALVLARRSNADAILEVTRFDADGLGARYFTCDGDRAALVETDSYAEYLSRLPCGMSLESERIVFEGRLVDADTGEVIRAFEIVQPVVNNVPRVYEESCTLASTAVRCNNPNAPFADAAERDTAREAAIRDVLQLLANAFASTPKTATAQAAVTK